MSVTLAALLQDVKSRLGETNTTRAAQLDSGVDATPIVTSDATIAAYLNEAACDLARWSWPIPGTGMATLTAGGSRVGYDALADGAGRRLHLANRVAVGGTPLAETAQEILRRWQDGAFGAAGTPSYWFVDGDGIGFDKSPDTDLAVTAGGFLLPLPMTAPDDVVDSLPDDLAPLLVYYGAAMVAAKNAEDPSLGPRVAEWMAAYGKGANAVKARAMGRDPETAAVFFAGAKAAA